MVTFALGVHYLGHKLNLAYKILSEFFIIDKTETLMRLIYGYFTHSLKKFVELCSLALLSLIAKMYDNKNHKKFKKTANVWF